MFTFTYGDSYTPRGSMDSIICFLHVKARPGKSLKTEWTDVCFQLKRAGTGREQTPVRAQ